MLGKPLVQFWSDRRGVIETLRKRDLVGWLVGEDRVKEAQAAVSEAAAKIMFCAEAGPGIVRLYAKIRGYDLPLAGRTLNGVHSKIGAGSYPEGSSIQCDAIRVCLGATKAMSRAQRAAIRRMLDEASRSDYSD